MNKTFNRETEIKYICIYICIYVFVSITNIINWTKHLDSHWGFKVEKLIKCSVDTADYRQSILLLTRSGLRSNLKVHLKLELVHHIT